MRNPLNEEVDRRGFLKCMAWAGTGVLWTLQSGILTSRALGQSQAAPPAGPAIPATTATLDFVQISDSHIGFKRRRIPRRVDHLPRNDRPHQRADAAGVHPPPVISPILEPTSSTPRRAEGVPHKQVFFVPGDTTS
jgi:hypothetical protein